MENRKHTSLKDLTRASGVPIPAVPRALKDNPEVSCEFYARVEALAEEMDYRPNPFAMDLRKNAPRIIRVVIPDIVIHFFTLILNGVENMAIANGYFVIIATSHEPHEHGRRNIENLVNMHMEGIVAYLSQKTTDFSHISALKDINMLLILLDRVCLTDQFLSVIADGAQSAQMVTQHLLDNGSKRVTFIGGANYLDIIKRRKHDYLEALRENHIPIEKELVVYQKIGYEEGKTATETLLSLPQPLDAILAINNTLAFTAMKAVKNHGLRIPDDVAIIGYIDGQHTNYAEPRLSAVPHQAYKVGEIVCQLLIDQIKGDKTTKQVMILTHL